MKLKEPNKGYGPNIREDGHRVFTIPLDIFNRVDKEIQGNQEDLKAYLYASTKIKDRILPSKIKELEFSMLLMEKSTFKNKLMMVITLHGVVSHVLGCDKCRTQKV